MFFEIGYGGGVSFFVFMFLVVSGEEFECISYFKLNFGFVFSLDCGFVYIVVSLFWLMLSVKCVVLIMCV